MAEIVGGFLMPHAPNIPNGGPMDDPQRIANVHGAFNHIAARVAELEADTAIIIGDDHYTNFGPSCIPTCLIVTGDIDGVIDADRFGHHKRQIHNNQPLARHILQSGHDEGIDWAFAKALSIDHAINVPVQMCLNRAPDVTVIPIYLNCVVAPYIASRRAYEIGQGVHRSIQSWKGNERVVIFGTGGLSHWVGSRGMGRINSEFDLHVLGLIEKGDISGLIALPDDKIEAQAGNGAIEIKNWICALGCLPHLQAETIVYEAMTEWITGCGFAELKNVA